MGWQGWRGAATEEIPYGADFPALRTVSSRVAVLSVTPGQNLQYTRMFCPSHVTNQQHLNPLEPLVRAHASASAEPRAAAGTKRRRRATAAGTDSENDSDASESNSSEDDFELPDSSEDDVPRPKRQRLSAQAMSSSSAISHNRKNYSRFWLQASLPTPLLYVPQVGDELVYIPEGHAESVASYRGGGGNSAPLPFQQFPTSWPAILAQIESAQYRFPSAAEEAQFRSAKCPCYVLCDITMRFLAKEESIDSGGVRWGEPRALRGQIFPDTFTVTYSPAAHASSDFLVLRTRYEASVSKHLQCGDCVFVAYLSGDHTWEEGKVLRPTDAAAGITQPYLNPIFDSTGKLIGPPLPDKGGRRTRHAVTHVEADTSIRYAHPLEPEAPIQYGWHEYTPSGEAIFEDARHESKQSFPLDVWDPEFGYGTFTEPLPAIPRYFTRLDENTAYVSAYFEFFRGTVVSVGPSPSRKFPGSHWKTVTVSFSDEGQDVTSIALDTSGTELFCPWELELAEPRAASEIVTLRGEGRGEGRGEERGREEERHWLTPEGRDQLARQQCISEPQMTPGYGPTGLFVHHAFKSAWTALHVVTRFDSLPGIPAPLARRFIDGMCSIAV
jgi:hypothetical protein